MCSCSVLLGAVGCALLGVQQSGALPGLPADQHQATWNPLPTSCLFHGLTHPLLPTNCAPQIKFEPTVMVDRLAPTMTLGGAQLEDGDIVVFQRQLSQASRAVTGANRGSQQCCSQAMLPFPCWSTHHTTRVAQRDCWRTILRCSAQLLAQAVLFRNDAQQLPATPLQAEAASVQCPTAKDYLEFVRNRQLVTFRPLEGEVRLGPGLQVAGRPGVTWVSHGCTLRCTWHLAMSSRPPHAQPCTHLHLHSHPLHPPAGRGGRVGAGAAEERQLR